MTAEDFNRRRILVILSFLAIYLIWGSTYLGIRIAVETLPPFLLTAVRFTLAGLALYIAARCTGVAAPGRAQWQHAALVGLGLSTLGNGLVVYAEQRVPSAFAACLIPSVPMWLTLLNWRFGERRAPHPLSLLGVATGFGGVLLLSGSALSTDSLNVRVLDVALLLGATLAWALATMHSRTADLPKSPLMSTAMQMLCGAAFLTVMSVATGEPSSFDLSKCSTESLLALAYLTVFGSIVAFTAYAYLARNVSPYLLGSYAFVNPVIAMVLGYWWYDEPLGSQSIRAAALTLTGVLLMMTGNRRGVQRQPETEAAATVGRSARRPVTWVTLAGLPMAARMAALRAVTRFTGIKRGEKEPAR